MLQTYKLDPAACVRYARRWAYGRNPAYYNFDGLGGDCTNFISQCLFAGGAVMNFTPDTGWYYKNLNNRAAAWTGVDFLYRFLTSNTNVGPFGEEIPLSGARPGDIVQLGNGAGDFYHSLLVVANAGGTPLLAAHTRDVYGAPLTAYSYGEARCLRVTHARREPDGSINKSNSVFP